uniref:Uncharacterized protein n=1 Tax=Branchiostoma floridae TaxID=7739 RepID=C3YSZ7_BRAFL|eukprot:XP_002600553.1 hypothetical protein BRAFLDRAFT_70070 [Branchiostoma floridae]
MRALSLLEIKGGGLVGLLARIPFLRFWGGGWTVGRRLDCGARLDCGVAAGLWGGGWTLGRRLDFGAAAGLWGGGGWTLGRRRRLDFGAAAAGLWGGGGWTLGRRRLDFGTAGRFPAGRVNWTSHMPNVFFFLGKTTI